MEAKKMKLWYTKRICKQRIFRIYNRMKVNGRKRKQEKDRLQRE